MHRREHKTPRTVHFPSRFFPISSFQHHPETPRERFFPFPPPRILSWLFAPSGDDGRRYSRWFSRKAANLRIHPFSRGTKRSLSHSSSSLFLSTVPFSLAAYIILPIEVHTSFPLYVSIYNRPRNICSSRSRGRDGRLEGRKEGRAAWADAARLRILAAELMYCDRRTMPRTSDDR